MDAGCSGRLDAATRDALKTFQYSEGLRPTGQPDRTTMAYLRDAVCQQGAEATPVDEAEPEPPPPPPELPPRLGPPYCRGPGADLSWNDGRPELRAWLVDCVGTRRTFQIGFADVRVSPGSVHVAAGAARGTYERPIGDGARLEIDGSIGSAEAGFGIDFRDRGAVLTQVAQLNGAEAQATIEDSHGQRAGAGVSFGPGAGMTVGSVDGDGDGDYEAEASVNLGSFSARERL